MTKDRFKQNRKKNFKGHNTAGYACQVNFSPDAKYVMSGMSAASLSVTEHPLAFYCLATIGVAGRQLD
jgi:hypothetical protein